MTRYEVHVVYAFKTETEAEAFIEKLKGVKFEILFCPDRPFPPKKKEIKP